MKLLLDLGNSRLKWAFADATLQAAMAEPWQALPTSDALAEHWQRHPRPDWVLGACVTTPDRRLLVDAALRESGWPVAEWLQSPARGGTLVNGYRQPAELGIDRFLAMLAALDAGLAPCVVASCGSALTLDALDGEGRHLGGQIVPGAGAMMAGLRQSAPTLPEPPDGDQSVIFARGTAEAMQAGVQHAIAAAIERFVGQAASQLQVRPRVVLCGGDADKVARLLQCDCTVLDQAVLRGLLLWARQHPAPR